MVPPQKGIGTWRERERVCREESRGETEDGQSVRPNEM